MCGIFGALAVGGDIFTREDYSRFVDLTDLVGYRGPDDHGYISFSIASGLSGRNDSFNVFLGHRRLSIIDLSPGGHQPMSDRNGCWISFNGEIFNFIELRNELSAKGHVFQTDTDTEVILHVYREYGSEGFKKLNGMWAFVLVDTQRRKVILSRDRFSIKPLYVLQQPNRFFFASEIKQLLPLLPKRELNYEAMAAFLAQGIIHHSRDTLISGIRRVPAKTNIIISLDGPGIREEQYWQYAPEEAMELEAATARFRDLLTDSVKIRLRSHVKVGLLLSGGLDSASIAVLANDLCPEKFETYSIVSESPQYTEEPYISAICSSRHLHNRAVMFHCHDALDYLDTGLYHCDEPFGSLGILAQFKLFQEIKRNSDTTVLLSGQGGDELLLGYPKFFYLYLRQLLSAGRLTAAVGQLVSSWLRGTIASRGAIAHARRYVRFLNSFSNVLTAKYKFEPVAMCNDVRERQQLDLDSYSVPALAHYEDRNSMAHSLEVRQPFLDHRLVNFTMNLPVEYKLADGWTKYVLRRALKELPSEIRWRRIKQGFSTAEELWLRRELQAVVRAAFRKSRLDELGMINDRAFLSYYDSFLSTNRIFFGDISRTFIAEAWARRYFA